MAPRYRILLDTSSLMYRAFFSMPQTVTNEQGVAVDLAHHVARGFDGVVSINESGGVEK